MDPEQNTARPALLAATVAAVMVAFAANSLLTRAALAGGAMGAFDFALWRTVFGAAALAALVRWQGKPIPWAQRGRPAGVAWLSLYMVGFSAAYLSLDAGLGALILFGGVQVTMFAAAVLRREAVPFRRWIGAAVSVAGLAWLLWPTGAAAPSPTHAASMAAAAVGWGLYSLAGQRAGAPLPATAANFVLAVPVMTLAWAAAAWLGGDLRITAAGLALAGLSGAVTSGLGYALWYAVLPRLRATTAALAQLSVPVVAVLSGAALLGETVGPRLLLASALVLGGIAIALLGPAQRDRGTVR